MQRAPIEVQHNLAVIREVQAQIETKVDTDTILAALHEGRGVKVVDAGVVVDVLIGHLDPMQLGEDVLVAPHLLDSEVLQVLRRLVLRVALAERAGATLLTKDARLAEAPGLQCPVELLR